MIHIDNVLRSEIESVKSKARSQLERLKTKLAEEQISEQISMNFDAPPNTIFSSINRFLEISPPANTNLQRRFFLDCLLS